MSRSAPRPLSRALEGFTATLAPASTLARVQECWEVVVGSAIAAAARPVGERDGVLSVCCDAAVWSQELDLMAPELPRPLEQRSRATSYCTRCAAAQTEISGLFSLLFSGISAFSGARKGDRL